MHVRFVPRLELPHPARPRNVVGEATFGAAGLIRTLELQLGLPPVLVRPGEALFVYRTCLAETDDLARFYRKSFENDPIGTSRTLLEWRSRWFEAGWKGRFEGTVPLRLGDMAAVEKCARGRVPMCHGERLLRIDEALRAGRVTQIDGIELHADAVELPAAWRKVLGHFQVTVAGGVWPSPRAPRGTDLERVQSRLREGADGEGSGRAAREQLAGDGSVMIVRAVSRDLSAQAVGEYLLVHGSGDTVVLAERDGIIVDNALERVGLPRAGFQHYTPFRAVHQVLELAMALVWRPPSPELLLRFLSHPVGPLPRSLRGELAAAIAEQPGIGGRLWSSTLNEYVQKEPGLAAEVAYWLENARFDKSIGAPPAVLAERARRVQTWLAKRLVLLESENDRVLFTTAFVQSEAAAAVLERLVAEGRTRVHKVELDLILNEVIADAPDPGTVPQAGHVRAATRAGQVTEATGTVVWWDTAASTGDVTYPWSSIELDALRANGVELPETADVVKGRAREWLRPILNTKERLVLVAHTREEGTHPVLGQVTGAFHGVREWNVEHSLLESVRSNVLAATPLSVLARAPLSVLAHAPLSVLARAPLSVLAHAPLDLKARSLVPRQLPLRRRWWALPVNLIKPRETESYSSLAKLLDQPHGWVLRHPARLRAGRAATVSSGGRLYGNLAHRLIELWFLQHPDWQSLDRRVVRAWLDAEVPALIEREGATLLEPGAGVERQRVGFFLERALERLLEHLRGAGIVEVNPEVEGSAAFADTRIKGTIDLLLTAADGGEIVLDLKWGSEAYRGAELAGNRYIQLATYAYLRRDVAGTWPSLGFFILTTGNLLATGNGTFANAIVPQPMPEAGGGGRLQGAGGGGRPQRESVDSLWKRIESTYRWRRGQLAEGRIEIVADDLAPDDLSTLPADALGVRDESDRFDDFVWLTGIAS